MLYALGEKVCVFSLQIPEYLDGNEILSSVWFFQDFTLHAGCAYAVPRAFLFIHLPQPTAHSPANPSPVLGLLHPEDAQEMHILKGKSCLRLPKQTSVPGCGEAQMVEHSS